VTAGPATSTLDRRLLWDAARKFATGIAVVTAGSGNRPGQAHGTTVSAFTFISREPALVAVSLARSSSMLELIGARGSFAINVLASHQAGLARHFADPGRGAGQFDGVPCVNAPWVDGPRVNAPRVNAPGVNTPWMPGRRDGVPLLIGAMCWLGCELEQRIPMGDHELVLGRVTAVTAGDGEPLLYFSGKFYAGLNKELG
jgi:flavin reductase (DIM6/NTAB) family NADH-FMN oxidoreductase RutF